MRALATNVAVRHRLVNEGIQFNGRSRFSRRLRFYCHRVAPNGPYLDVLKPIFDRTVAALALILVSPVLAVCAAAVWMSLGPGVIYRQPRVGYNDQIFTIYKFRTMLPDRRHWQQPFEGADRRQANKSGRDPRVTRVGRLLRRSSLDELPQLWNVLRGDMSLVGPRPELVEIVERKEMWLHPRSLVRPGLTGLWQISEHRNEAIFEHLELDMAYLRCRGVMTDLRILMQTFFTLGRKFGQ